MVIFRQKRLCEEMARPVDYADAQRFRWVTILHVWVPVGLGILAGYTKQSLALVSEWLPFGGSTWLFNELGNASVWPPAVCLVCFLLFLAAATGVPSYFFHPRDMSIEQQNRAISLSYYTSGPLAFAALPVAAWVLALPLVLRGEAPGQPRFGLLLFAILFSGMQVITWWLALILLARRLMPRHKIRMFLIAPCVPVLWAGLGGLILGGLPAAFLYIAIVLTFLG